MQHPASTDPGPLRADARRNRTRLLAVAHEAFLDTGVTASMDEIARRAGVGIGTLYRHFPTREALILALVADDLERLANLADERRVAGDVDAADVERWLDALVAHNLTYRGLAESIAGAAGRPTPLGAACDRIHAAGAELVAAAQGARRDPPGRRARRRHRPRRRRRLGHRGRPRRPAPAAAAARRHRRPPSPARPILSRPARVRLRRIRSAG